MESVRRVVLGYGFNWFVDWLVVGVKILFEGKHTSFSPRNISSVRCRTGFRPALITLKGKPSRTQYWWNSRKPGSILRFFSIMSKPSPKGMLRDPHMSSEMSRKVRSPDLNCSSSLLR